KQRAFGETLRQDLWWLQPVSVACGLGLFIVYSTWAAFQGTNYSFGSYLSPFYSPELFGDSPHSWFGPKPSWFPAFLPWSPALRKKSYDCVSCLNRRHMLCAWLSLFWVGFSDLYVRLCSMGIWHDWRLI